MSTHISDQYKACILYVHVQVASIAEGTMNEINMTQPSAVLASKPPTECLTLPIRYRSKVKSPRSQLSHSPLDTQHN